jgi:drug/metabolite transporter (DMT)-like permease
MAANVFILLALQRGPLGEGAVVSSLYPAVTVVLSALILGESVRRFQWAGLAMAVAAMGLIAA